MPTTNARADTAKVHENFSFRVLRQNRRVVSDESRRDELELFHRVLTDISLCRPTEAVKQFLINAYVRGARDIGSADRAPLEGNTAVFTSAGTGTLGTGALREKSRKRTITRSKLKRRRPG